VDVIVTWTRSNAPAITQALFQDIQVFAVGRRQVDGQPLAARTATGTVTLLLEHQQALALEYLLQTGARVSLGLRRFDQIGEVPTEAVTSELLARRYFGLDGGCVER
jgi:Flp pilus assembly protein CpaB